MQVFNTKTYKPQDQRVVFHPNSTCLDYSTRFQAAERGQRKVPAESAIGANLPLSSLEQQKTPRFRDLPDITKTAPGSFKSLAFWLGDIYIYIYMYIYIYIIYIYIYVYIANLEFKVIYSWIYLANTFTNQTTMTSLTSTWLGQQLLEGVEIG